MPKMFRSADEIVNPWKKEWPTKEGFYMFYGYLFNGEKKKTMRQVEVIGNGPNCMHSAGSYVMSKSETGEGYFKRIETPDVSDLVFEVDNDLSGNPES